MGEVTDDDILKYLQFANYQEIELIQCTENFKKISNKITKEKKVLSKEDQLKWAQYADDHGVKLIDLDFKEEEKKLKKIIMKDQKAFEGQFGDNFHIDDELEKSIDCI